MNEERIAEHPAPKRQLPRWVAPALFFLLAAVVALLVLLGFSIMERRWEAQRPSMVLRPIAAFEPDNAVWGRNYPREYETYLRTRDSESRTRHGGPFPRDYLEDYPDLVVLFAGYGFSEEYLQARGHFHSLEDVKKTKRVKKPFQAATCWSCKSTDVPRVIDRMGAAEFYASNFHDLAGEITHPIGCQDCHDPATMNLRITRPGLREAFARQGRDIDGATHQELRSLVCAQCHVEYYFAPEPKNYLTFPWDQGSSVEEVIAYFDGRGFTDWVHGISKTPMIKAQHPDFELWQTGVHAYQEVSCADCHMPYRTEGGVKFTDHHVRSPLLNVANSCAVCHRWSEAEVVARVESIQDKVQAARRSAEGALARAHFDIAAAMQAGCGDEELAAARKLVRHAQFRWDFVAASNSMGFHSPQEAMRILGDAVDGAQQARLAVARLLAARGVSAEPAYPDTATRAAAWEATSSFVKGAPPALLPVATPAPAAPDAGPAAP
jgi:nitrite reductase (cytochrome c-552)